MMLDILARASVDGAIFVTIVWVLCRAVPGLPARAKSFLWWCAAAKFVVALVWTTPVLLPVLPATQHVSAPSAVVAVSERHPATRDPGSLIADPSSSTGSRIPNRESGSGIRDPFSDQGSTISDQGLRLPLPWSVLILAAWGLGCGVSAYRGVGRWRNVGRVVGRSSQAAEHVQLMASDLAAHIGLGLAPEVRMSDEVVTPLVTGLRRPVVLLPLDRFNALSDQQQRMTLCHELVHLKRWDLCLGCAPAMAERLFFFHPLAHAAVREYLFWREAACDAAVLEALDVAPQEYGGLLLNLGVARPRTSLTAAGAPWSFSILKRRIVMLRDPSAPSVTARVFASAVIGLALAAIAPLQLSARPSTATPAVLAAAVTDEALADDVQRAKNEPREDKLNFVLFFDEDRTTMSGSVPRDIDRARRFKRPGEPMLWFRMAGREYVVRDPQVLREIEKTWEGPNEIGAEQGKIGRKQGEIGTRQGEIGTRQGQVGTEQGVVGTKQGIIGTRQGELAARESSRSLTEAQKNEIEKARRELDDQMKELDREMRKLDERMRELDEPMRELDEQMKALDKEMSVLGGRMEEAVNRAEEAMRVILQRAISSGAAQTVR
jgi:bla regulator protein BlaR1